MAKQTLLILELWGIGDLILCTSFLRQIPEDYHVVLLGKKHARATLAPTYRNIEFIQWDAPWTRFRGKYRLWRWDWRTVIAVIQKLRRLRPEFAVSVRKDPRDHFLMWMVGARRRIGFGTTQSKLFLTDSLAWSKDHPRHIVDDWLALSRYLFPNNQHNQNRPWLDCDSYTRSRLPPRSVLGKRLSLCLHVGARIPVRRWPESYFAQLIEELRARFNFHISLIPDPDGYGRQIAHLVDEVIDDLRIAELIATIGRCDLLISNDSAPSHIAAACGTPVIVIFGPTDPTRFRPWAEHQHVVIRDFCPYRPCFDYCHFPEPFCLTKLRPNLVWPEIEQQISGWITEGVLPSVFNDEASSTTGRDAQ